MPFVSLPSGVSLHYIIPSCPDNHDPYLDPAKPTVLLLHPRFFDAHFCAPQYRDARLSKAYNLVVVDHHYHGRTECVMDDKPYDYNAVAKDILAAMDILKIPKAHLVGNCIGAHLAVRMCMLKPDRVASLALLGMYSEVESGENIEQYRYLRDACYEKADDGSDQLPSDVVSAWHWIGFGDHPGGQHIMEEWAASSTFRPSNRQLITKIFSTWLDMKPVEKKLWLTIKCPVLIIHGGDDAPYPPQVATDIYNAVPKASDRELHIVPQAPHFVSWTHAGQVNSLLANFLDKQTGIDSQAVALLPRPTSNNPIRPDKYSMASLGASLKPTNGSLKPKVSGFFKRMVM